MRILAVILASLALTSITHAAPPTPITVGSKAPPLAIHEFVKGAPVKGFEKGKVYLVEFWATWCGPCIASMPHLSQLQEKYAAQGLTVIGVTAGDDDGNTLDAVKKFVAGRAAAMRYTAAFDDGTKTYDAYMHGSGEEGIPCSFLINRDGVIAYIGTPRDVDVPLAQVIAGTHDLSAEIVRRNESLQQQLKDAEAIARTEPLQLKFIEAVRANDKATALKLLDEIEPLAPILKPRIEQRRFIFLLTRWNDPDAAYAVAERALEDPAAWRGNAGLLNAVAWTILDPKADVPRRDPAIARRAAARAVELTSRQDPDMLDTLARAQFLGGEVDDAIATQTAALALALDEAKPDMQASLAEYTRAREGKAVFATFQAKLRAGEVEAAMTLARTSVDGIWNDNSRLLNECAAAILTPRRPISNPDILLAERAARRADDLTSHKDPTILATLARVNFTKGEREKAIELQTLALTLAPAADKPAYQAALDEYKKQP